MMNGDRSGLTEFTVRTTLLLAAVAGLASDSALAQESRSSSEIVAGAQQALDERDRAVAEVLAWLSSMEDIPSDQNAAATEAIRFLAEVRSPAAVPVLRRHWMFLRFSPFHDQPSNFAAVAALAHIGLPGIPVLIAISAEGYEGEDVHYPVSLLAAKIPCPAVVAGMFDLAATTEPDAARSARLRQAAGYIRRENDGDGVPAIRAPITREGLAEPLASQVGGALEHRRATREAAMQWLLSMGAIPLEQQANAVEAIRTLGEFRAPEAVEALRKHALFTSRDPPTGPADFVALSALAKIGLPAIPALIDIAAEGREGEALDYPLVPILASMAPPQLIADHIEPVAEDEIDPDRYARLKQLAEALRAEAAERQ